MLETPAPQAPTVVPVPTTLLGARIRRGRVGKMYAGCRVYLCHRVAVGRRDAGVDARSWRTTCTASRHVERGASNLNNPVVSEHGSTVRCLQPQREYSS